MSRQVFFQVRHLHGRPCRSPAERDDDFELAARFSHELRGVDLAALLPPAAARLIERFIAIEEQADVGKHPFPFAEALSAIRAVAALVTSPPAELRARFLAPAGPLAPHRRLVTLCQWLERHVECGDELIFDLWCSTSGYD